MRSLAGRGADRLARLAGAANFLEALEQILDEVFRVLASRRKTQQAIRETQLRAFFRWNRRVRHCGGMADQRLYAAEALREREIAPRGGERDHLFHRAIQLER